MPELYVTFELIDGATNEKLDADLTTGDVVLGAGVNIAAIPSIGAGSAVFLLDGVAVQTESVAPYALFGDSGGDFAEGNFADGDHTLEVVFYSEGGGQGAVLGGRTITFTIGDGSGGSDGTTDEGTDGTADGGTDGSTDGGTTGGTDAGTGSDGDRAAVLAVNAGGSAFTDANGVIYQADTFGAGGTFTTGAEIGGTDDDALYQSETWGNFTYDIAVENGTYDLELNFAEIWGGAASAGQRVFDVFVEGQEVFSDLDISDRAGVNAALDLIGQVEVTDGALTISAVGDVQNPKISAFSLWEASGDHGAAFTVVGGDGSAGGGTDAGTGGTDGGTDDGTGGTDGGTDDGTGGTGGADGPSPEEIAWRAAEGLKDYNNDPDHAYYIEYNPTREVRGEHGGSEPLPSNEIPAGLLLTEWADQIVFQYDGNNNDEDDISALPVAALMTERFGLSETTTFFYGNNIAESTNEEQHKELTDGAMFAEALGIDTVDVQANADAAVQQLAAIYNSGQKILSIEGGPMEIVYRALELTTEENLENIWLLSHSTWNEKYPQIEAGKDQDTRSWYDVANDFPTLKMTDIFDQNGNQNRDEQYDNQNWADLGTSDDPVQRAARDVMEGAGKLNAGKEDDASDAGMLWFALTGDERGNAQQAIARFDEIDFAFDADADLSFIEDPDVLALFS